MTSHYALYKHVCWQLLRTELIELRKTFFDQAINLGIWVFCTIVVMGYITKSQFNISNPDFAFLILRDVSQPLASLKCIHVHLILLRILKDQRLFRIIRRSLCLHGLFL